MLTSASPCPADEEKQRDSEGPCGAGYLDAPAGGGCAESDAIAANIYAATANGDQRAVITDSGISGQFEIGKGPGRALVTHRK